MKENENDFIYMDQERIIEIAGSFQRSRIVLTAFDQVISATGSQIGADKIDISSTTVVMNAQLSKGDIFFTILLSVSALFFSTST